MRPSYLIILLLIIATPLMSSFVLDSIVFEADFEIDEAEFGKQSGLIAGSRYEYQAFLDAKQNLQTYLSSNTNPYILISNPELIPIRDDIVSVRYTFQRLINTDNVSVSFTGLRYFSKAKLQELLYIDEDSEFQLAGLPELMNRILKLYNDRAYLFAEISLDSLAIADLSTRKLRAYIKVSEGSPFRLESIICQGNSYSKSESLIKLSGLRQIRSISPLSLDQAAQRILSRPYIKTCDIIPLNSTTLLIKVTEGRMTYLEGLAGLNRISGKTELTGLMNLRFLNLWGSDRSIRLFWRKLQSSSDNLELSYHESGFSRYPIAGDISMSRITQDSTYIQSKLQTEFYYYNQYNRMGLELSAEQIIPGSRRPIIIDRSSRQSIGGIWHYSGIDLAKNPSRGTESSLKYRFLLSPEPLQPGSEFELDVWNYLPISYRWITALGAHIRSLDTSEVNSYDYFSMGGYNSLRGYNERYFSAWRLAWLNTEIRYRLNPESRLYLFYDQGFLSDDQNTLKADIFSLGLGIKYRTRLGILSLEYGLGYNPNSMWDLEMGIVHIGLDTSF